MSYLASLIIYAMSFVISAAPGVSINAPAMGSSSVLVAQELMESGEVSISTSGTDTEFKKSLMAEVQAYVDAVSITSATPEVKGSVILDSEQNEEVKFSLVSYDDEFSANELKALSEEAGGTVDSINEFLCKSLSYAEAQTESLSLDSSPATAKGSMNNGQAVCEGYANAFAILAEYAGIKSVKVRGYVRDILHVVNVTDGGFVVDVTWNDKSGNRYLMIPYREYCEISGFVPMVDYKTAFVLKYRVS